MASARGGLAVEWIWTDDLVRGWMTDDTAVPPEARRWIDTPVAIRFTDDDEAPHRLARLLGLDTVSPDPAIARTTTRPGCPCAEDDREVTAGVTR